MHSCDGYVRILYQDLIELPWAHFVSEEDPADGRGYQTGSAEWMAPYLGSVLSLAWDWRQSRLTPLEVDLEAGLRTNFKVLDRHGYDLPWQEYHSLLVLTIERLNWRQWALACHRAY